MIRAVASARGIMSPSGDMGSPCGRAWHESGESGTCWGVHSQRCCVDHAASRVRHMRGGTWNLESAWAAVIPCIRSKALEKSAQPVNLYGSSARIAGFVLSSSFWSTGINAVCIPLCLMLPCCSPGHFLDPPGHFLDACTGPHTVKDAGNADGS